MGIVDTIEILLLLVNSVAILNTERFLEPREFLSFIYESLFKIFMSLKLVLQRMEVMELKQNL